MARHQWRALAHCCEEEPDEGSSWASQDGSHATSVEPEPRPMFGKDCTTEDLDTESMNLGENVLENTAAHESRTDSFVVR